MLVVEGLTCRFGTKAAVDNASFSIAPGGFVGVIGRSGAGKSTLLRMINRSRDRRRGPYPLQRRRCHGVARPGAAAMAGAFGHDLPAVQPGRSPRRPDQRADGTAVRNSLVALAGAALARRGRRGRDVGAGTVRHGVSWRRNAPTSSPAASSSASRSRVRWFSSPTSSSPTSRSHRSIPATPGS